jgi:hypothetical protein
VIGAVGVTGDTEDRDEELAVHGIHAAGLRTDADCAGIGRQVGAEAAIASSAEQRDVRESAFLESASGQARVE